MMHSVERILAVLEPKTVVEKVAGGGDNEFDTVSRQDLLLALTMMAHNISELERTKANRGLAPEK